MDIVKGYEPKKSMKGKEEEDNKCERKYSIQASVHARGFLNSKVGSCFAHNSASGWLLRYRTHSKRCNHHDNHTRVTDEEKYCVE